MMVLKVETSVEKLPDNIGSGGNFTEISNSLPDDYFIQSRVGGPACERISETTDDSKDFCRYHKNNRSAEKCKALSMDFLDSVEEVKSLQGETKMKVPFPVPDHIGPACRLKFHEIGKYINEKNRLELGSNVYQHAASSVPSSPFKNDFHLERCIYFDNPERNEAMRNAAIQRFIDSNNFETKRNITPTLLFNTSLRRRSQVLTQLDNVKSYCRKMRQSLCETFFKKSNMKVGERITASDVDDTSNILINAIDDGNVHTVKLALTQGAVSWNVKKYHKTPFQLAFIRLCRIEVGLESCLSWQNCEDSFKDGSESLINILFNKGQVNVDQRITNPDDSIVDWELPIHYAARLGSVKSLKWLLDHDCEINCKNAFGETPLMLACLHRHVNAVALLMLSRARIDICNRDDETVLHYAAKIGNLSLLELFCCCGCDKLAKSKEGKTPNDICIDKNYMNCSEFLAKYRRHVK